MGKERRKTWPAGTLRWEIKMSPRAPFRRVYGRPPDFGGMERTAFEIRESVQV